MHVIKLFVKVIELAYSPLGVNVLHLNMDFIANYVALGRIRVSLSFGCCSNRFVICKRFAGEMARWVKAQSLVT